MSTPLELCTPSNVGQPRSGQVSLHAREVTKKDWEALKPLIVKLYITDNKTLPQVREILKDTRGLIITYVLLVWLLHDSVYLQVSRRKQFQIKAKEWKLQKYTSKSERHAIIQKLACSSDDNAIGAAMPPGIKVTEQKVARWVREADRAPPLGPVEDNGEFGLGDWSSRLS